MTQLFLHVRTDWLSRKERAASVVGRASGRAVFPKCKVKTGARHALLSRLPDAFELSTQVMWQGLVAIRGQPAHHAPLRQPGWQLRTQRSPDRAKSPAPAAHRVLETGQFSRHGAMGAKDSLRHNLHLLVLEPKERLDDLSGSYSTHRKPTTTDSPIRVISEWAVLVFMGSFKPGVSTRCPC